MDLSEHSIHNHGAHMAHEHGMLMSTSTVSPIDVMNSGGDKGMLEHQHIAESGHVGHDHGSPHDHSSHDMSGMHMMAFHFGCEETILFSWWKVDTVLGLIGSMVVIFLMAIIYEGLKYYREYLFWKTYNLLEYRPVTGTRSNPEDPQRNAPSSSASPVQYVGEVMHKQPPSMFSLTHFFQTFLHIIQVTLSFLLMLIFMTFNVWLCIAVVLGAAVGYFLFCWKKSVIVDVTEHCH